MHVQLARPDVAELVFRFYDRSIHPELLPIVAVREMGHSGLRATIGLGEAGHVVTVRHGGRTVTEIAGSSLALLPSQKRLVDRRLRGSRDEQAACASGLRYQASFVLDVLDPEVFLCQHEELLRDSQTAELSFRFPAGHRLDPGALSVVRVEATRKSLLLHAFHTFPEQCAVVKTQSLFET